MAHMVVYHSTVEWLPWSKKRGKGCQNVPLLLNHSLGYWGFYWEKGLLQLLLISDRHIDILYISPAIVTGFMLKTSNATLTMNCGLIFVAPRGPCKYWGLAHASHIKQILATWATYFNSKGFANINSLSMFFQNLEPPTIHKKEWLSWIKISWRSAGTQSFSKQYIGSLESGRPHCFGIMSIYQKNYPYRTNKLKIPQPDSSSSRGKSCGCDKNNKAGSLDQAGLTLQCHHLSHQQVPKEGHL